MSSAGLPVTLAVTRPDGSIEHVRVGTAVRVGDSFRLSFADLTIGGVPDAAPMRRSAPPPSDGGMVFPPYGRSKGAPVAGASMQDLEYYANGCRRTLNDPAKARWHDKERQLLAAIESEIARQGGAIAGGPRGGGGRDRGPAFTDDVPMFRDEDMPPPNDDVPF